MWRSQRRSARGFTLALCVCGSLTQPAAAFQDTIDIESIRRATVTIQVTSASGGAQGSGFVLTDDGIIATAAHVLEGATAATVIFLTGEEYPVAGVLAVDAARDFALIRVAGFGLPTLTLGNSDSVGVGQRILAFGAPLGLDFTVTDGLLSSDRMVGGIRLLQISVPVSPGSSGGPVTTEDGLVVGLVVSGILSDEAQNLNFALPINYLRGALALAVNQPPVPLAQWQWEPVGERRATPTVSTARSRVVNDSLNLVWETLDGAQFYSETRGDDGARWETTTRYNISLDAEGTTTLERYESTLARQTGDILKGRQAAEWWRSDDRTVVQTQGGNHRITSFHQLTALHPQVEGYSTTLRIDGGKFSFDSAGTSWTGEIPYGVYTLGSVAAVVGAWSGPLPDLLHLWIVTGRDQTTEAVRIEFGERVPVQVPVPRSGTQCEKGTRTTMFALEAVEAVYTIGATRFELRYLALEPHMAVLEDVKCMVIPGLGM